MVMTMLYVWVVGAVLALVTIYVLLRRWYTEENFDTEGSNIRNRGRPPDTQPPRNRNDRTSDGSNRR